MEQRVQVLVENQPGVLARVAALYAEQGVNIDSFSVQPVAGSGLSRMLIVTSCDPAVLAQIVRQMEQLPEVKQVEQIEEAAQEPPAEETD